MQQPQSEMEPTSTERIQQAIKSARMGPTMKGIDEAVIRTMGNTHADSQAHILAWPRHVACFLMKSHGYSYPEIGRYFGKHHTTVLYSRDKVAAWLNESEQNRNAMAILEEAIKSGKYEPLLMNPSKPKMSFRTEGQLRAVIREELKAELDARFGPMRAAANDPQAGAA